MLTSDYVLENWSATSIFNYARENEFELNYYDAYELLEQFPEPPAGWLVASDPTNGSECFCHVYWCGDDAEEDGDILKEDGMIDIELTTSVDHETMCEFLQSMLDDMRKQKKEKGVKAGGEEAKRKQHCLAKTAESTACAHALKV